MPKQVEYFRWLVWDPIRMRERKTRFQMDRATAEERYPGCRPDPLSRELRTIYEPGEDPPANTKPPSS